MALTVRPDDEVYQFDTVWLGPDEYTLPIQARYVAWGTWLACFLAAAAVLIPLGGSGPGSVIGSLLWAIALSVVASRAVMLVVDHERPLRSLPALFSAEARAALAASGRGERSLLVRPAQVRVRELPDKARRMRDRRRATELRRAERSRRLPGVTPSTRVRPGTLAAARPEVLPPSADHLFQSHQTSYWSAEPQPVHYEYGPVSDQSGEPLTGEPLTGEPLPADPVARRRPIEDRILLPDRKAR
jgi:hypothetical protein